MIAKLRTENSDDEREIGRRDVLIGVRLRRAGESWFNSRISDLSMTGFRLQSFLKLAPDTELWIMLPGFEGRRATVLWARDHEAGCRFERSLHPAIFEHIVRTAGRGEQEA
jgi:hypothetical protein